MAGAICDKKESHGCPHRDLRRNQIVLVLVLVTQINNKKIEDEDEHEDEGICASLESTAR